jgi:[protein-PII] uridylyltransferase
MDLILNIENLIEMNASDFEISKLFKQYIQEYQNSLQTIFEANQGKDFLVKNTKELDKIISLMYKTVLRQIFGIYLPMRGSIPIVVVALGSYGREQLCVHSDIDLMIVYEQCEGYNSQLIIEKLLYLAWDSGLKLGHRVHEVGDLSKAADEDITIKTAMMESRFIVGSNFTWHSVQRQLGKIKVHKRKEFILAKIEEAQARHKKYPTSMQPNIKESIGGLRDSQLLFWIAKSIYKISSLKDLNGELFTEEEYSEYRISLELLFRVRSALHLLSHKQEDRLLLEQMPQVSRILGFTNEKKLATKVFQSMWRINNFTKIFTKKMIRPFLIGTIDFSSLRQARLAKGIFLHEGRLYASYHLQDPNIHDLLKLLISLPDKHYRYDAGFLNLFTYCNIKIPLAKTIYPLLRTLFYKENTYWCLKLFYEAGVLHKLFHSFKQVMFMPQFDGYHHYPVDIHSIKAVQALETIQEPNIQAIYDTLGADEKLLLKVAVFIHDAGKGRKQDHSEVGVRLFTELAKRLGFDETMTTRGAIIIRHHILMSSVAFRENFYNETVLYSFISKIKNEENLKLLYILTYADINGVGKGVYTSFSAKLLWELYTTALEASNRDARISDATKRLYKTKRIQNTKSFQTLPKSEQKKVLGIESDLFYIKYPPEEIVGIAKQARQTVDFSFKVTDKGRLHIEIFRRVPLNISYLLGNLSYLDVGSMDIFTLFDGIKYFKIEFSQSVEEDALRHIKQVVEDSFDMQREIQIKKPLLKPEEITIDCNHSNTYIQLNVHTKNQRGLLAYIMGILEKHHINIATAKVDSTKTKARDSFLIEKQPGMCDNIEKLLKIFFED